MGFGFGLTVGLVCGMVVGWFLLPTPAFIQRWWVEKMGWPDRV